MNLDHVFKKTLVRPFAGIRKKPEVPEGLLCKCSMCKKGDSSRGCQKKFSMSAQAAMAIFVSVHRSVLHELQMREAFLNGIRILWAKIPMEFEGYEEKSCCCEVKDTIKMKLL